MSAKRGHVHQRASVSETMEGGADMPSGGADVLVGVTSRLYSIHFASTSVLTLTEDGESESSQICGLEALLAVGLNINPGIIPEIEQ